jgi:ParB family chromosome partitioning protein
MSETIQVLHIPVDKLKISKLNVRHNVGDISEISDSMKSVGVLEPLIVRPSGRNFEIIVGSRRFTAAKKAGLRRVPAIVRQMKDDEALLESLVENLQRGDIGEEEIVRAYNLLQKFDPKRWNQKTFAEKVGKSGQWMSNLLLAYQSLVKLKQAGVVKGMSSYPKDEERERGIAPIKHLIDIDYAMRSEQVQKTFSEKELERKRAELARNVLDLPQEEAEKVIDRFKMYPEKSIKELKQEALATPSGIAVETYVKPSLARQIEERLGVPVEEA